MADRFILEKENVKLVSKYEAEQATRLLVQDLNDKIYALEREVKDNQREPSIS